MSRYMTKLRPLGPVLEGYQFKMDLSYSGNGLVAMLEKILETPDVESVKICLVSEGYVIEIIFTEDISTAFSKERLFVQTGDWVFWNEQNQIFRASAEEIKNNYEIVYDD